MKKYLPKIIISAFTLSILPRSTVKIWHIHNINRCTNDIKTPYPQIKRIERIISNIYFCNLKHIQAFKFIIKKFFYYNMRSRKRLRNDLK